MLGSLLPRNRVKVLGLLLGNPSSHYYLREIARVCGIPLRAAQRELALYEAMGLIRRVPRGRQVFFAVDTGHLLFAELRALIEKASDRSGSAPSVPPPASPPPVELPAASGRVSTEASALPPPRDRSWRVW